MVTAGTPTPLSTGNLLMESSRTTTTTTALSSSPSDDAERNRDPVYFPSKNAGEVETNFQTFTEACLFAAESHRPLHLLKDVEDLPETIVLRKRQYLTIHGGTPSSVPSPPSSSPRGTQTRISGKSHSLFLLNNHSQLRLLDLELVHEEDDEPDDCDCRKVGAAVNLRYKSKVWIEDCSIRSHVGFCCWAVQKASIGLERSYLEAPLRSALVCFGQARLEGRSSTIANAGVHGVCARGECLLRLTDCSVTDSAVRGLYAYANASVRLEGCTVSGTVRPDTAAIEVSSALPASGLAACQESKHNTSGSGKKNSCAVQKTSSLTMNNCRVTDNAGVGVRIRGGVRYDIKLKNDENGTSGGLNGNCFVRNSGGNEIDLKPASGEESTSRENEDAAEANENQNGHGNESKVQSSSSQEWNRKPQRDASGSSFRKGDWWCPVCLPRRIVPTTKDSCPCCQAQKSDGKFLSTEEVIKLNRGTLSVPSIHTTGACETPAAAGGVPSESIADPRAGGTPTWWFDADDDVGWVRYDTESIRMLERAFQLRLCLEENDSKPGAEEGIHESGSPIVLLCNGKYRVNLETMEQINTDSHFLRLVQRRT